MNPDISVTLVGPEYPINVGYMARLMKNFGLEKLFLVEPRVDLRIATVYASHGGELVASAERVPFDEVRRRHDLLIATTAIRATRAGNLTRKTVRPEDAARYAAASGSASFVFGRDTTGLTNEEIDMCDIATSINTGTAYRTLNLTHAASIVFYLVSTTPVVRSLPQSRGTRDAFVSYGRRLSRILDFTEHGSRQVRETIRRVAVKAELNDSEISTLTSLLRKATEELEHRGHQTRSRT